MSPTALLRGPVVLSGMALVFAVQPGVAQIAIETDPPRAEWLTRFLANPEAYDYRLEWTAFRCPSEDQHHQDVLTEFLAHEFDDRALPHVARGMTLLLTKCHEPRALLWLRDRIRALAPSDPLAAHDLLLDLPNDGSPEQVAFLVELARAGIAAEVSRPPARIQDHRPVVVADDFRSDFGQVVASRLIQTAEPDTLIALAAEVLGTDRARRWSGGELLISHLAMRVGEPFFARATMLVEQQPELITRSPLVHYLEQALSAQVARPRDPGTRRLILAIAAARDRSPEGLDPGHLSQISRLEALLR